MSDQLERRQSLQTIAWFNDLYRRQLLDLDPPYQRRSVWNLEYQQFFIETILLRYPAPAIFLHEEIESDGTTNYHVVDGKQRLTTLFEYVTGDFAVAEDSSIERHQGKYFAQLDDATKKSFWSYQFLVEYLPTTDESILNNVFDRINRNVAKLTRQELRHAKFDGRFASSAEEMSELMEQRLPSGVPHIASASRRQMKDVELVAQLLLLVENGPQSFSQDELDLAYSIRDPEWEGEVDVRARFTDAITYLSDVFKHDDFAISQQPARRIKNQADFYSLFGAAVELKNQDNLPPAGECVAKLNDFLSAVQDEEKRETQENYRRYYEAARSASNDLRQRNTRIDILIDLLKEDRSV
ncbi:DUF262 domain-containing protein [Embleya sp. NPDC055664]